MAVKSDPYHDFVRYVSDQTGMLQPPLNLTAQELQQDPRYAHVAMQNAKARELIAMIEQRTGPIPAGGLPPEVIAAQQQQQQPQPQPGPASQQQQPTGQPPVDPQSLAALMAGMRQ